MQYAIVWTVVIILLGALCGSALGADSAFKVKDLEKGFRDPANAFRGFPLGGFDFDKPQESAEKFRQTGWGGIILHYPYWDGRFLQDKEGWAKFQAAVKACEDKGLDIWIYDECHYPSGKARDLTAKGHPEYEPVGLFYASMDISIRKAEEKEWIIPQGTPYYVAVCPLYLNGVLDIGALKDVTDKVKDGVLKTTLEPGTWRLMAFVRNQLHEGTHAVATGGKYVNIMDPKATARFLEVNHEEHFRYFPESFGNNLKAFFTDEPSLMGGFLTGGTQPHPALSWWDGLPDAFQKDNGYDIRQTLPALFNDIGHDTVRMRCDYYSTISQVVAENYFGVIQKWCRAHKVASTGHLLWEESLIYHANFYGSVFPSLAKLDWPGIDVLGCNFGNTSGAHIEGGPVTPKLISSAAHIYNKERTITESFCFVDEKTPVEELCAHVAWQWVLGINTLSTLSVQQKDPPEMLSKLNEYAGRLSYMLTQGKHVADTAVLYPIASVWADFVPTNRHVSYVDDNPKAKDIDDAWREVSRELLANRRDFDYIDEDNLQAAKIKSGKIAIGNNSYSMLVLPNATTLRYPVLKKISEFVKSGGTLISYGAVPVNREDAGPVEEFRDLVDEIWASRGVSHAVTLTSLGRILDNCGQPDVNVAPKTKDIYYHHRTMSTGDIYFLLNNSKGPVSGDFTFRTSGKPGIWNPFTGEISKAAAKGKSGRTSVNITVPGRSGVFVVFEKGDI